MAFFEMNDVVHNTSVKFVEANLPTVKKTYHLKAVHQPMLDINGVASKAALYNVSTNPQVIEEGLQAGMQLMFYLIADGYRIKTPLFNLALSIPGEYDGAETSLANGVYPKARLRTSRQLRKYLRDRIKLVFTGIDQEQGNIAAVIDEATGNKDSTMTKGNILTITGNGLKIETDQQHTDQTGLFFIPESGETVKASAIPVNESRKLKVIVPTTIQSKKKYTLMIGTMSSARGGNTLLKKVRIMKSRCTLAS